MTDKFLDLRHKTILVTGAAGHIGRCYCKIAASLGASLIIIDNDDGRSTKLLNELQIFGEQRHEKHIVDFADKTARNIKLQKIKKNTVKLDGLINNAAFTASSEKDGWATSFEEQTIDAWDAAMAINLDACFDTCKAFGPILKQQNGSFIVNVGSIYGSLGPDYNLYENTEMCNPAAYGVSKAGLIQLTRWLASTLAPNVRVNCLSPGGLLRGQDNSFLDRYTRKTPLGRLATEDDVARMLLVLSTPLSSYMTGQNVVLDGGYSIL